MPAAGGHVGFIRFTREGEFWHETRVADFATAD
jgi:predicted alpha/beta-fold hydrolase